MTEMIPKRLQGMFLDEFRVEVNFRERYLGPALENSLNEMTIPEKPRIKARSS